MGKSNDIRTTRQVGVQGLRQHRPDEEGVLSHGRGCYTQSEDGGGDEYIEECDEGMTTKTNMDAAAMEYNERWDGGDLSFRDDDFLPDLPSD